MRTSAREHLPSYREPASRNPQAEPALTFLIVSAIPRTVSPSLGSCPASGGASSFLPASALLCISFTESCDPKKGKARDASDQLLPPERYCDCPYLVRSWFAPRLSSRGHPTESWAPCGLPGDRMLHGTRNASADHNWTHTALPLETSRLATRSSRAWTFSVHGAHCDRASDISVASPSFRGTVGAPSRCLQ